VSSIYRVLCLSHDPAIAADTEYSSRADAEAAVRNGVSGHETCDLMIGRYSYPLVELGCPGKTLDHPRDGAHKCYFHRDARWIGVEWVRLLAYAQQQPEGSPLRQATADVHFACFPPERLHRLRLEIGTDTPEEHTQ